MNASDWKYLGEGGKHVVFAYEPKALSSRIESSEFWVGRLIRFDKDILSAAPDSNGTGFGENDDPVRAIMYEILQPYIDLPEKKALPWGFVQGLRDQACMQSPSRRRSWLEQEKNGAKATHQSSAVALVLRDYRLSVGTTRTQAKCVSIEIKPKAGYRAFSPLVDPQRSAKFIHSRYALLQKLYRNGKLTKDWMGPWHNSLQSSSYDPQDLFSGESQRVRHALESLMTCPQNNLKIWAGDSLILGSSEHLSTSGWNIITEAIGINKISEVYAKSMLVEMTSKVLTEESFLSRLLALQRLDILE